jgi:hypothetical protein
MAMDHTNCTHPRTATGRRACRNGTTTLSPRAQVDAVLKAQITTRARVRQAMNAQRIQPRRSGARVDASNSTCVQAALHTRGKCACGWENWAAA